MKTNDDGTLECNLDELPENMKGSFDPGCGCPEEDVKITRQPPKPATVSCNCGVCGELVWKAV